MASGPFLEIHTYALPGSHVFTKVGDMASQIINGLTACGYYNARSTEIETEDLRVLSEYSLQHNVGDDIDDLN
jgi:hypothetical protein